MRRDRLKQMRHDERMTLCGVTDKRTRLLTDEVGVAPPEQRSAGGAAPSLRLGALATTPSRGTSRGRSIGGDAAGSYPAEQGSNPCGLR